MLFAALLAALGGGAAAVGAATGDAGPRVESGSAMDMHGEMAASGAASRGLAASAAGYTFEPVRSSLPLGESAFRFRIVDGDGRAAHDFDVEGGVRLHLIVVRRDFAGYTHLHPRLQADGSWLVPLRFGSAGVYRAFADFEHDGKKIVLGRDLFVAGAMTPLRLPAATPVTRAGGYRVQLAAPELRAGKAATLRFTITRAGEPVRRFEPYVGMRGHLVALHDGDLAYSHVHPLDDTTPGRIAFETRLTAPGSYRVFLQFKVAGRVVTAPFTIEVAR